MTHPPPSKIDAETHLHTRIKLVKDISTSSISNPFLMISYGLLGKAMRTGLAVCDPQISEIIQQSCGMGARDVDRAPIQILDFMKEI